MTAKSSGEMSEEIKPLTHDLHELSVHKGCLFWENFVIIPDGSTVILATPHVAHSGIIHCVWWPGNDSAIEKTVTKCRHMPSYSALSSKRTSFPMGSYQEVLVNNPNFFHQTFQTDLHLLMFCLAQSQPKFMSNGSYACYCKALVVRYFSFGFMWFVNRSVIWIVNIIFLINGKHLEIHFIGLHLEMSIY